MKIKHFLSFVLLSFVSLTSCKKDGKEENFKESQVETKAFVSPKEAAPGTADFGVVYFDLDKNTSSETESGQVKFQGRYTGDLHVTNENLNLAYIDVQGKTLATLTIDDIAKAELTFVEKLTTGVWYTYDSATKATASIPNRYVIVYQGEDTPEKAKSIYVIKLNSINYVISQDRTKHKGDVSFSYKSFKK